MYMIIVIATIMVWILFIGMMTLAMNSIQNEHFHSWFTKVRIVAIMLSTLTLVGIIT